MAQCLWPKHDGWCLTWKRSPHNVNNIWSLLTLLSSFSFLCFPSYFPEQYFTVHFLLLCVFCYSPTALFTSVSLYSNCRWWWSLFHPFHFVQRQTTALLAFLNQHKSSFIIQVTWCLLNALKCSFKYLLCHDRSARTDPPSCLYLRSLMETSCFYLYSFSCLSGIDSQISCNIFILKAGLLEDINKKIFVFCATCGQVNEWDY